MMALLFWILVACALKLWMHLEDKRDVEGAKSAVDNLKSPVENHVSVKLRRKVNE